MQILQSLSITILFAVSFIAGASDASAQQDEITGFTVVSDTPGELILNVMYHYSGLKGNLAYIGASIANNGRDLHLSTLKPGHIKPGYGSTRLTLGANKRSTPPSLTSNQIYLFMYGGNDRNTFHGKFFPYVKTWQGDQAGGPNPPQPTGTGQIIVTTTVNRPMLSRGQQTAISVYARDRQGRPIPHAMVTLSSGGGRFVRTATPTVSGPTDSSGFFVGYWTCDPCARGYVGGAKVTKQGYTEGNGQWRVQIR